MASAMAMIMYYVRFVDPAFFNNKIAAHVRVCVCGKMGPGIIRCCYVFWYHVLQLCLRLFSAHTDEQLSGLDVSPVSFSKR